MITQYGKSIFGRMSYGGGEAVNVSAVVGRKIAVVGDPSSHGGAIVSSGQDGTVKCGGTAVAVNGASHSCPIPGHGTTSITAVVVKSYINGKLIVTYGATAGCGAIITPPNRKVLVEA